MNELKPCPFEKVEKELGHKPYTLDIGGLWYIQCTCGARGPISPTEDYAINTWNTRQPNQEGQNMFSVRQKQEIADKVQQILRDTAHPELPNGEIYFHLHVMGAENWSWADIRNNGAVSEPSVNPWNEKQDK